MSPIFIILSVVLIITCMFLITVILMQKKRASGMSGVVSGAGATGGASSTYWDKNKGRSMEGKLETYTKVSAVIFFILTFLLGFIR